MDTLLAIILTVVLGGVLGGLYPRVLLFWAHPGCKTRLNAILFGATVMGALAGTFYGLSHGFPWLFLIMLLPVVAEILLLRKPPIHPAQSPDPADTDDPADEDFTFTENNEFSFTVRMESFSGDGSYEISPDEVRCTCPDWTERRASSPLRSPCRICKHLAAYYAAHPTEIPQCLTAYAKIIAGRGRDKRGMPHDDDRVWYGPLDGEAVVMHISDESWPWCNILIRDRRYGLNVQEGRWAYNEVPPNSNSLIAKAKALLGRTHERHPPPTDEKSFGEGIKLSWYNYVFIALFGFGLLSYAGSKLQGTESKPKAVQAASATASKPVALPSLTPEQEAALKENFSPAKLAAQAQGHNPAPYRVCSDVKSRKSGPGNMYSQRVLITPVERDLSKLTSRQLAETAYSALQYHCGAPDVFGLNVLLFETCGGSVMLARAQSGTDGRKATSNAQKTHGPRAELVRVSEAIIKVKKGDNRVTTDQDYAKAGKALKMPGAKVKDMHLELAGYMGNDDFYDAVVGTEALHPALQGK